MGYIYKAIHIERISRAELQPWKTVKQISTPLQKFNAAEVLNLHITRSELDDISK